MTDANTSFQRGDALATDKQTDGTHVLKVEVIPGGAGGAAAVTEVDTYVTASASSKQICAASATRKGAYLYALPGSAIFYGRFGIASAGTTLGTYEFRLFPDDHFPIPNWLLGQALQGIWESATGGLIFDEGN